MRTYGCKHASLTARLGPDSSFAIVSAQCHAAYQHLNRIYPVGHARGPYLIPKSCVALDELSVALYLLALGRFAIQPLSANYHYWCNIIMDIPQSAVNGAFRPYQGPRARLDPGRLVLWRTSSTLWESQPVPPRLRRPTTASRLPEARWMFHSSHFRKLYVASDGSSLRWTYWEVSLRQRVGH